jgi:MYXO-CTERM domain-containing protein
MSYDKINAIAGCLKTACQTTCDQEVSQLLFAAAVCTAAPPVDTPDAGSDAAIGGGHDAGTDAPATGGSTGTAGATGATGAGGHSQSTSKSGGCAVAPRVAGTGGGVGSILLAAVGLALLRRRRRDHRRRR